MFLGRRSFVNLALPANPCASHSFVTRCWLNIKRSSAARFTLLFVPIRPRIEVLTTVHRVIERGILAMIVTSKLQLTVRLYITMGAQDAAAVSAAVQVNNMLFSYYILIMLSAITASFFVSIDSTRYIRHLTCLNDELQRYFTSPHQTFGFIKQHLLYAPLFIRRHGNKTRLGRFAAHSGSKSPCSDHYHEHLFYRFTVSSGMFPRYLTKIPVQSVGVARGR